MSRGVHTRTAAIVAALLAIFLAGCSSSIPQEIDPPRTELLLPLRSTELPGLPDPSKLPNLTTTVFSEYFIEADEVMSQGASWDGNHLRLEEEGLSYAMLATACPVYESLQVTFDGEGRGMWLAVSDYPANRWRWFDGPLNGNATVVIPPEVKMSLAGTLFFLLVCPEGSSADLLVSRLFVYDKDILPDDLGYEVVVPDELQDEFDYLMSLNAIERSALRDSEDVNLRRALYYYESRSETPSRFLIPNCLVFITYAKEKGDGLALSLFLKEQLGASTVTGPAAFWGGKELYSLYWPRELFPADRAWIKDWVYSNYPQAHDYISPNMLLIPGD